MKYVGFCPLYLSLWSTITATTASTSDVLLRSGHHASQRVLLEKAALVDVVIEASGDPGHHGSNIPQKHAEVSVVPIATPAKSPQLQALTATTPPTATGNATWIGTPAYKTPTPPPLLWGRPDKIREWRLQHGLPSNAVLPDQIAKGGSVHIGGWDPCLFASTQHPSCIKRGVALENVINHGHYERRRHMVLLMIVVVVVLSIGFDKCHETLMEKAEENGEEHLVRMVKALMKELTVLGFISLLGCMFIRSGRIGKWSVDYFGHPPEEVANSHSEHDTRHAALHDVRAGHCVSELTVLFEDIHLFIFCVMLSLIFVSALNMVFLYIRTKAWREAEATVRVCHNKDLEAIEKLAKAHREAVRANNLVSASNYDRQIKYLIHKSEFLHPSGTHPHHNVNKESFSFFEYLKHCIAEAVTEQMEIPTWIYGICLVLLLMIRPLFSWQGRAVVLVFLVFITILAVILWVIFRKLVWIQRQLVPGAEKISNKRNYKHSNMDHDALLDLKPVNRLEVKSYRRFIHLRMMLYGTCSPSPHEQLFWFHRRGPLFMNNLLRLLSFILAIFLGEWLSHMIKFRYTWQNDVWSIPIILLMSGIALVMAQDCIIKSVAVTSTEISPRQDVISHINHKRNNERQRYHKELLDYIKIQAVQRNVFVTLSSGHKDWIRRYGNLPQEVQRRIHKTWNAFDADKSGSIDRIELDQCLHSLGKQGRVDEWLKALNADEYGEGLSRQQFNVMMVAMHEAQHAPLRKPDAIAVLAGMTLRKTTKDRCIWEGEGQQETALSSLEEKEGEILYDVERVSKLLFTTEIMPMLRDIVGVPENYQATDFLQCVRERTAFYKGGKRQDEGKGLSATINQIVAYLVQVNSEAHPEHRSSKLKHKSTWEEEELNPEFGQGEAMVKEVEKAEQTPREEEEE